MTPVKKSRAALEHPQTRKVAKLAKPRQAKPRARSARSRKTTSCEKFLSSLPAWKSWRTAVFRRDGFQCVMCYGSKPSIDPHHIKRKVDRPDLMFDVDNGVTLCRKCHLQVTDHERMYETQFQAYITAVKVCTHAEA